MSAPAFPRALWIVVALAAVHFPTAASAETGPERAERFLKAMGGREAWAAVEAVIVRATHHEANLPAPYANVIWNDFRAPRVRIEAKSETLDVRRAIDGDKGWRWRAGNNATLTAEQLRDERRWWEANLYRTLHRLARRDPTLSARAVGEQRLEIFRDDGTRLNWVELNAAGEPMRFGSWESETGSVFGPLGSSGGVNFPRWGSNAAGTWRYEIVEFTPLPALPAEISFTDLDPAASSAVGPAAVVRAYYDAFNRHDAAAVAAFCDENLKWYSINGDKMSADAENREQLTKWLTGYFKSLPSVRSEIAALEQTGPFLCVRERPTWTNKAGKFVSQQALGIYEVRAGRILRVWYFPSSR